MTRPKGYGINWQFSFLFALFLVLDTSPFPTVQVPWKQSGTSWPSIQVEHGGDPEGIQGGAHYYEKGEERSYGNTQAQSIHFHGKPRFSGPLCAGEFLQSSQHFPAQPRSFIEVSSLLVYSCFSYSLVLPCHCTEVLVLHRSQLWCMFAKSDVVAQWFQSCGLQKAACMLLALSVCLQLLNCIKIAKNRLNTSPFTFQVSNCSNCHLSWGIEVCVCKPVSVCG